jgi:osmoprotectant transport system ATP-binding protein
MSTSILEFDDVTKVYPDRTVAIENISFEVEEGTTTVFVGPSGCGKTTTLRLVNRLEDLTEGEIRYTGTDIRGLDKIDLRRDMGYVIQEIGLFDHMTVSENVATVPKLKEWDDSRIENRVTELLELVDLPPEKYKDQYPRSLSGGQRQRVGVARALAADPNVLLMDEPFGALDPITREKVQNEFLDIQDQIQKTILFVTHDINEAMKMGDKIAIYNNGNIVQYDTPRQILANPANEFVEEFIGADRMLKQLQVSPVEDVMDTSSELVGLTVADLRETRPEISRNGAEVRSVTPSQRSHVALAKLYEGTSEFIPVVEDSRVVGIVTQAALQRSVGEHE